MTRVNILSPGFDTANSRALLFPIVFWRKALGDHGLECHFFHKASPGLTDCDVLLVDSKFHRDEWKDHAENALSEFASFAECCRVIYADTTDSSGWIQTKLLPIVHGYAKAQLIKDRSAYLKPMYGQRLYTDYYHRTLGISDAEPEWSVPVTDPVHLQKLRVSWNSGLADYSLHGPAYTALYHRLPLGALLRFPRSLAPPSAPRPHDVSCRFGTQHARQSVAIQRRLIHERMASRTDTRKLSRRAYFQELRTSKIVVSPFGFGEINLRDFEVFLTGGLLLKPDMSHMETWPDLFRAGETMLAHAWDLSDFDVVLDRAVADYPALRALAERGQETYRAHLHGPQAIANFAAHFRGVIAPST